MNVSDLIHRAAVRLSIWFRWTSLRSLSNSYATRSAILIPLVGYILLFSGKFSEWFAGSLAGGSASSGGVSNRLLWIYFGLCFIAVGNVLYSFFCTQEIKDY